MLYRCHGEEREGNGRRERERGGGGKRKRRTPPAVALLPHTAQSLMHSLNRSLLLLAGIGAAIAAQVPLTFDRTAPPLLAPESASSFISHDTFTTLSHPDFTSHSVRIKRTTGWCDSDVRSYSGYLDVGAFESSFGQQSSGSSSVARSNEYTKREMPRANNLYAPAGSKSTFFWYFDSRTAPQDADLMLWTNGGPGCSSSMGLLMELGPCRVQSDANSTKSNPYSCVASVRLQSFR